MNLVFSKNDVICRKGSRYGGGVVLCFIFIFILSCNQGSAGGPAQSPSKKNPVAEKTPAQKSELKDSVSKEEAAKIKIPDGVQLFEKEGDRHVEDGISVAYKTDPPTSGQHYGRWVTPGLYKSGEAKQELLVHNLEHGNVVIYFNPITLPKDAIAALTPLTQTYNGQWDGVVLVHRNDAQHPLILTAWQTMLRLKRYDKGKVDEFIDAFRGRGPENAVR